MLGSLETAVQIIRESSRRCLGLNLGPVLLTAEPALYPLTHFFLKIYLLLMCGPHVCR